jgi:hypothetical protein
LKPDARFPSKETTMNGTKIFGVALLAAGLGVGQAVAADLWLHVRVHGEKGADEAMVNLPIAMARNLAGMIPEETRTSHKVRVKDRDYSIADLRQAWHEVENGPDANYITVNDPTSRVKIGKRGNYLELRADDKVGSQDRVEARIPLPVVAALLSGSGDRLNVDAALEELTRFGEGELLTVTNDRETVRIWVDHTADAR